MENVIPRSKFTITRRKRKKNVELNPTCTMLTKEDIESFLKSIYEKEIPTEVLLHTGPRGAEIFRKTFESYLQTEVSKATRWGSIDLPF